MQGGSCIDRKLHSATRNFSLPTYLWGAFGLSGLGTYAASLKVILTTIPYGPNSRYSLYSTTTNNRMKATPAIDPTASKEGMSA